MSADGYRMALKLTKAGTPAYGAQMAKAMALASKRQIAGGCTTLDYHPPLEDGTRTVLAPAVIAVLLVAVIVWGRRPLSSPGGS